MSEQPGAAPDGTDASGGGSDEDPTVRVREQTANDLGDEDAFDDTDAEGAT